MVLYSFVAIHVSLDEYLMDFVQGQEDGNVLSYWLSNISTLLFLLQRNLRSNSFPMATQLRLNASVSYLGRLTQVSNTLFFLLNSAWFVVIVLAIIC